MIIFKLIYVILKHNIYMTHVIFIFIVNIGPISRFYYKMELEFPFKMIYLHKITIHLVLHWPNSRLRGIRR